MKNYLLEKLSKEEKVYLKRTIMTARNLYIKKNRKYLNSYNMELKEEIFQTGDSFVDSVIERCLQEVKSAEKFAETLSNPLLCKNYKALSLREKEVLFYLFSEKRQINDIAQILGIHRNSVGKIRDKALTKIAENMLKEGMKNV